MFDSSLSVGITIVNETFQKFRYLRREPDRHQNLIGCSFGHDLLSKKNFNKIRSQVFEYLAGRETDAGKTQPPSFGGGN